MRPRARAEFMKLSLKLAAEAVETFKDVAHNILGNRILPDPTGLRGSLPSSQLTISLGVASGRGAGGEVRASPPVAEAAASVSLSSGRPLVARGSVAQDQLLGVDEFGHILSPSELVEGRWDSREKPSMTRRKKGVPRSVKWASGMKSRIR